MKKEQQNELYAIHFEGKIITADIWRKYSKKYGETGRYLQGWKPPKKIYYTLGTAKCGFSHLPLKVRKKAEIVRYIPDKL